MDLQAVEPSGERRLKQDKEKREIRLEFINAVTSQLLEICGKNFT